MHLSKPTEKQAASFSDGTFFLYAILKSDLDLPEVPHDLITKAPENEDFDLPDITPGYTHFTSSIRYIIEFPG